MRLFCRIILVLFGAVGRLGYEFTVSNAIAAQFVGDYLSRLTAV